MVTRFRRSRSYAVFPFAILLIVTAGACAQEAEQPVDILDYVSDRDPEVKVDQVDMERLRVRRIDIVDENGVIRMTLAAPLPNPVVDGIEYKRSVEVSGIMLRDDKGNERGGFAYNDRLGGPILALDHFNAEATGFSVGKNGQVTMFMGQAPELKREPRLDNRVLPGQSGPSNISIQMSPEGTPSLVLTDKSGRPRLRFSVADEGYGTIQFLNEEGEVISSITPETLTTAK